MDNKIVDEVQQSIFVTTLDSVLNFCYAEQIFKNTNEVANSKCRGCEVDHPSQTRHQCLMLCQYGKLEFYFEDILESIDQYEVIRKWKQQVSVMNIPSDFVDMYSLKVNCKDWRETSLKTDEWKEKIYLIAQRLITLENRF